MRTLEYALVIVVGVAVVGWGLATTAQGVGNAFAAATARIEARP